MRKYKLNIGNFEEKGGTYSHHFPNGDFAEIEECEEGKGFHALYYKEGNPAPMASKCTGIEEYQESEVFPGCSVLQGEALNKAIDIINQLTIQFYEQD